MVCIYILKCKYGKWYIGKSDKPFIRIQDHFVGNGAEWCKRYPPIEIHQVIKNCDTFDEDKYVKKFMSEYGIDNVRGGSYVQENVTEEQRRLLQIEINGANDACFTCGSKNHFARDCKNCIDTKGISFLYNNLPKAKTIKRKRDCKSKQHSSTPPRSKRTKYNLRDISKCDRCGRAHRLHYSCSNNESSSSDEYMDQSE